MKTTRTLYGLLLILALAITGMAQEGTSAGSPKLYIESFTHDFGEIKSGTELKYSFIVKNQGKAILEIRNVAPS